MPKSDLVFGSFDTSTSGGKYYKTQPINFPTPEKDVAVYEVPGRSGDLIVDYGSYKNVEITAEIVIQATTPDTFLTLYDALRAAIMVQSGYQRLEDSLYPNEYRVARCTGVEMQQTDSMRGTATITFDAKPQRYLTSGESVVVTVQGETADISVVGLGDVIFNASTKSLITFSGYSLNETYTVIKVDGISDAQWVKIYYPSNHPESVLYIWSSGGLIDGEAAGSATASIKQVKLDDTIEWSVGMYAKEFAVYGAVRWEVLDTDRVVLASGTSDSATIIPPVGVIDYSPLIRFTVSGAVSGIVAYLATDKITLNTPASVGEGVDAVTLSDIIIDCETLNAYTIINNAAYNLNKYVSLDGVFTYPGGKNMQVYTNSKIDSIEVTPRWWKL